MSQSQSSLDEQCSRMFRVRACFAHVSRASHVSRAFRARALRMFRACFARARVFRARVLLLARYAHARVFMRARFLRARFRARVFARAHLCARAFLNPPPWL